MPAIESISDVPTVPRVATVHDMDALKQLACAVIQRAIEDAQGDGWNAAKHQAEARGFLLNEGEALEAWCVLAGLRVGAVKDYARRRGYSVQGPVVPGARLIGRPREDFASARMPSGGSPVARDTPHFVGHTLRTQYEDAEVVAQLACTCPWDIDETDNIHLPRCPMYQSLGRRSRR